MLHVARECAPNPPAASPPASTHSRKNHSSLLTFGEFCLLSADLQRDFPSSSSPVSSHKRPTRLPQLTRQISANNHKEPLNKIKSNQQKTCEVFLGGSCNPTTWRQDTAIPLLKDLGISYYNPQVTHWNEGLVEIEHIAKSTASVLFFVFDRRTRNVASMVEVAYIAASKRKIMLVLDTYPGPGHLIGSERISRDEYEELSGGLNTVQDLVERKGIPVFSQIPHALHCTAKIINEDLWPQQLGIADDVTPVKNPCTTPAHNYSKIQDAFEGGCSLPLSDAQDVFADIVGRPMTHDELMTVVAAKKGVPAGSLSVSSELPLKEVFVTLEEFCCIVAEFSSPRLEKRKLRDVFTNSVLSSLQKTLGSLAKSPSSPRRSPRLSSHRDSKACSSVGEGQAPLYSVYLGGSVDSDWQGKVGVPLLKENDVTFCLPGASTRRKVNGLSNGSSHHLSEEEYSTELRGRLYPSEAQNIEQCQVLLFVVTGSERGVSSMALASHYIGLGSKVVLCVQDIQPGTVINGEELSTAAIKDYNRGRSYLKDQAKKDGVPVFSDVSEAISCVLSKVKSSR